MLLAALPALAQAPTTRVLFANFDLDTPTVAATANRVVTSVAYANGTLTLAAQPDSPRNLTATLTDGDVSCSGTFLITGADVDGNVITDSPTATQLRATFTGTKVYASVASIVISGASGCTGADVVVVGVGSTTAPIYCTLGNPIDVAKTIQTTSSSATIDEVVASSGPFTDVAVGDQITVVLRNGVAQTRYVATRASAAQITVAAGGYSDSGQPQAVAAVNWSAGYAFSYRHHQCGYSSGAGWVPLGPGGSSTIVYALDRVSATGGVTYSVECRVPGVATPVQISTATDSDTVWPANTGAVVPTQVCSSIRVGLKLGTNDDSSDAITEALSVAVISR